MKIFNKKSFVEFVRSNDYLYIDGGIEDSYENDMKIVNDVFDGDGIYGLEFGSRGEVEFIKINNFVEDLIEWKSVSEEENEFRYLNNDDIDGVYLDLNWEEELSCSYFIICEEK